MKKYLIGVCIVVILIIAVTVWIERKPIKHTTQKTATTQRAPFPKEVTIILTKNGFTPIQTTIKVDSAIRWINKSGSQQTVNSDNYPTNQLHKELNFGVFANNSSVVHTFTKPGIYGYHNQLHPNQKGKVTVIQ